MIYRGDNGIKLIFTLLDNGNEPMELDGTYITFSMVYGNTRVKKLCRIIPEEPGKCYTVLESKDTQIPGMYKYQLTVKTIDNVFSSNKGKLKILSKV